VTAYENALLIAIATDAWPTVVHRRKQAHHLAEGIAVLMASGSLASVWASVRAYQPNQCEKQLRAKDSPLPRLPLRTVGLTVAHCVLHFCFRKCESQTSQPGAHLLFLHFSCTLQVLHMYSHPANFVQIRVHTYTHSLGYRHHDWAGENLNGYGKGGVGRLERVTYSRAPYLCAYIDSEGVRVLPEVADLASRASQLLPVHV